MQAKQSSTASEIDRIAKAYPQPVPIRAPMPGAISGPAYSNAGARQLDFMQGTVSLSPRSGTALLLGEGLLHDAGNLIGALGLYCDMLSAPGVLKPEHGHYAQELRLLSTRSGTLIEHLMQSLLTLDQANGLRPARSARSIEEVPAVRLDDRPMARTGQLQTQVQPVSLRGIVERYTGLLSRVAGGRQIEVSYGAAAGMPVRIEVEAVERILVNLVRNAAAALHHRPAEHMTGGQPPTAASSSPAERGEDDSVWKLPPRSQQIVIPEAADDLRLDEAPGAVRIGVGLLANQVGDARAWPFRRVLLTVEDSGCGMNTEQLERLLRGGRASARGRHGIGFRVVLDLVAASGGELRVMSVPGVGTRVQIEWPVARAPAGKSDAGGPGPALPGPPRRG